MNISPVVGSLVASCVTAVAIMVSCRPSPSPVPVQAPVVLPDAAIPSAPVTAPASVADIEVPPALAADLGPALPSMSPSEAAVLAARDLGVAVDALVAAEKARR